MPASGTGSRASAPTAGQSGVSGHDLRPAFRGITDPDPEVLEKARTQPEFTAPAWDYFDNRVHDQSVAVGQQMASKWKPWLDRIEAALRRRPLHPARHLVDGIQLRRDPQERRRSMRNVVRSLATLAYADPSGAPNSRAPS